MPGYKRKYGGGSSFKSRKRGRGGTAKGRFYKKSSYGSIMRRRPTAGTQKVQIASLSKKVSALQQVQSRRTQTYLAAISKDQYLNDNDPNILGNTEVYSHIPLINFMNATPSGTQWEPVFGSVDSAQKPNLLLKKIALKWQILCKDDAKAVTGTTVIMAPKTKEVFNDYQTNGLQDKIDYYQGEGTPNYLAGKTLINLKRWRVFYMKGFTVWGRTTADSNPAQSIRMASGSKTLNLNYHLKNSSNDIGASWLDLTFDDLPYYMAGLNVFCFNSADDDNGSSAHMKIQGTITGSTYD